MIELDLTSNLDEMEIVLDKARTRALPTAIKRTLRRAEKTLTKESVRKIRMLRAVKARDIRQKYFRIRRNLRTKDIRKLEISLWIKDRPIPFSEIMRGSKTGRKQKGVRVKSRRPVRVRLRPGQSKKVEGGFVARGPKSSKYEVFRRETVKKGPIVMQSAPSLHVLYLEKGFRRSIEQTVGQQMAKEFVRQYKFALEKLKR